MASCSARIVTALPAPQSEAVAGGAPCARSLVLATAVGGYQVQLCAILWRAYRIANPEAAKIEDALKVGGVLNRLAIALERRNGFP